MIDGFGGGPAKLKSESLSADITEAITGDVALSRKMDGASELTLTVSDSTGKIRKSRFLNEATRLRIDGLTFALVKTSKTGLDLSLTAEDEIVYRLRQKKGPKKAYRDKMTRAQFAKSLVREVDRSIKFISPELAKVQPIADGKEPGKTVTSKSVDENRESGIPKSAKGLTVKGTPANATQKDVADQVIRAAQKYKPPRRALLALLCAATQESVMGTAGMTAAVDHDSVGLLQARLMYVSRKDAMSIPYNVKRFLVGPPWTGTSEGGAIKQANAGRSITDICASIQGMRADLGGEYVKWKSEAEKWMDAYTGGGSSSTSTTTTTTKRYAFQVTKKENYWDALKRLADEVGWRCFVVGKRFYFIAETTLFESRRRMFLGEDSQGVEAIDWDIDSGKKAHTATITGRISSWKAPPGTVVELDKSNGPAEGRWLVDSIDGTLNNTDVTINLKRRSKPKPEPASETTTDTKTSGGSPGSASASSTTGGATKVVTWCGKVLGTNQGSSRYNHWMSAVNGGDPWCSDFVAFAMQEVAGLNIGHGNWHYSDYWSSWSGAKRVSLSQVEPGDIVGYSGCHVAIYVGHGKVIGGNISDTVSEDPWRSQSSCGVSYVARPKYK